jgi:hypothetical protein
MSRDMGRGDTLGLLMVKFEINHVHHHTTIVEIKDYSSLWARMGHRGNIIIAGYLNTTDTNNFLC